MAYEQIANHVTELPITAARVAGTTSGGIVVMSWITQLNAVIQLLATTGALVSAIFAGWWYYENARKIRRENKHNETKHTK